MNTELNIINTQLFVIDDTILQEIKKIGSDRYYYKVLSIERWDDNYILYNTELHTDAEDDELGNPRDDEIHGFIVNKNQDIEPVCMDGNGKLIVYNPYEAIHHYDPSFGCINKKYYIHFEC